MLSSSTSSFLKKKIFFGSLNKVFRPNFLPIGNKPKPKQEKSPTIMSELGK